MLAEYLFELSCIIALFKKKKKNGITKWKQLISVLAVKISRFELNIGQLVKRVIKIM